MRAHDDGAAADRRAVRLRLFYPHRPGSLVTKPPNFDFRVGAGGNTMGAVDGKTFRVFGQPSTEFPADAVAAAIAAWEMPVADDNAALKTQESRANVTGGIFRYTLTPNPAPTPHAASALRQLSNAHPGTHPDPDRLPQ